MYLQFALFIAASCGVHRTASRVIHHPELYCATFGRSLLLRLLSFNRNGYVYMGLLAVPLSVLFNASLRRAPTANSPHRLTHPRRDTVATNKSSIGLYTHNAASPLRVRM